MIQWLSPAEVIAHQALGLDREQFSKLYQARTKVDKVPAKRTDSFTFDNLTSQDRGDPPTRSKRRNLSLPRRVPALR